MFDETGCDGIAVARGALGNPWIFGEINEFLKNGKAAVRPLREKAFRAKTKEEIVNLTREFFRAS